MRTALLAAVGHDLRTPLAVGQGGRHQPAQQGRGVDAAGPRRAAATADESLDRLARLVDNLLDMSRLQAGALSVLSRPVALDEVVALALDELGPSGRRSWSTSRTTCPYVQADPGLLERVVANLVDQRRSGTPRRTTPPVVTGSALGDRVELRVIDRGPGIPPADRERVFAPFQRLGDTDNTTGVGLGLALVARADRGHGRHA